MNHEEYLMGIQLISDETLGRKVRESEAALDQTDATSRRQLGVTNG